MNYKLSVVYEGTRYKGWQRQKNSEMTIQGKIESVLSRYFGHPIEINGASRTDAGVHAAAQVANFKTDRAVEAKELMAYVNQYLPEDIGIFEIEAVPESYHARFHTKRKVYLYRLWTADYPPVFQRREVFWHRGASLDMEAMKEGAKLIEGKHDFKGFCTDKTKKSTERNLREISIAVTENEIRFIVEGDGFLYNMVRIIVGTLLEIGEGKRTPESVLRVLETGDRALAGETAPAQGLLLYKTFDE